jgi:hypothetical protein
MKPRTKFLLYPLIFELLTFICLGALNLSLVSCNTTEPPPPEKPKNIALKEITKSCTETFLTVSAKEKILPASVKIKRDGKEIMSFYQTGTDTTIIDTALTAGKTYNYQALTEYNGKVEQSKILPVRTLDTTSNNFNWQTYTFGSFKYGSSVLNDVAIINENDIWAVGEIHTEDDTDSTGHYIGAYNAVHWNGEKWELKRIMFYIDQDQPWAGKTSYPCQACFLFDDGKLAVSSNVQTAIFNSTDDYQITKMGFAWEERFTINSYWGTSSDDFYVVGEHGNIAHYNGKIWEKIESGTDLTIHDIWGIDNNGKTKILSIASEIFEVKGTKILSISSTGVTELPNNGLSWSMAAIWFSNQYIEYAGGGGLYSRIYNENHWKEIPLPLYYIYSIRGNGPNDIVVCGGNGYIGHFNGITWKNYLGSELSEISGNYYSSAIKGNTVAAVGVLSNGKAIAVIGKR